jgi:sugar lactone lactonase YvrE
MQPEIVFDGHAAIGGGAGMGDRQQRLLWLDIPHGRVHRFDPAAGSDDVFVRIKRSIGPDRDSSGSAPPCELPGINETTEIDLRSARMRVVSADVSDLWQKIRPRVRLNPGGRLSNLSSIAPARLRVSPRDGVCTNVGRRGVF